VVSCHEGQHGRLEPDQQKPPGPGGWRESHCAGSAVRWASGFGGSYSSGVHDFRRLPVT
jgi:hypothetical protein